MTPQNQRKRVAILGGGPAALTSAFELTATPELREQYEVTVHQLGWRLGGKGASGRNAAQGQRIEEHGLHIWFGFYDNAFSLIRRCYEELDRTPGTPLATWDEAFKPDFDGVQFECFEGEWVPHYMKLPGNDLTPGDPHDFDFWEIVKRAAGFLQGEWERLRGEHPELAPTEAMHRSPAVNRTRVMEEGDRLGVDLEDFDETPVLHLFDLIRRETEEPVEEPEEPEEALAQPLATRGIDGFVTGSSLWLVSHSLNRIRDWVWDNVVKNRVDEKDLRFFFMLLDLTAAMATGIRRDRLRQRGFGAINDKEFRDWLSDNGASELTTEGCPLIRAVYSAAFCFEDGDPRQPNVAAGKAAQDAIRLPFFYKGAPMYKMSAGMGDTVFAPLYEVLRRRGVRFEFFHCITRLGLSPDKSEVDVIEFVQQADVTDGAGYEPLVDVRGLPCWPSEPDWAQLDDGDALRAQGVDFERNANPRGTDPLELRRGEDFDLVVLGIPVGALKTICEELADANPDFKEMLDNSHTVMTQAFQVWMKRNAAALGFPFSEVALTSCYVEPLDTYCDMSQTLPCEDWQPGHEVDLVAYFCGVLPSADANSQAQGDEHVKAGAMQYLNDHIQELWPNFAWDHLADANNGVGEARFDGQYWRANFTPSEQYVLTLAGSVQYRLWPHQSGFTNLALAGDWTRNGIDGGAVEAAVTSGMLASRAISGSPAEVEGVSGWLTSDRGDVGWTPPGVLHA